MPDCRSPQVYKLHEKLNCRFGCWGGVTMAHALLNLPNYTGLIFLTIGLQYSYVYIPSYIYLLNQATGIVRRSNPPPASPWGFSLNQPLPQSSVPQLTAPYTEPLQ